MTTSSKTTSTGAAKKIYSISLYAVGIRYLIGVTALQHFRAGRMRNVGVPHNLTTMI
jgi:hypothetical protein